ncbi:hypothetical protein PanWU01x14_099410 [Parasponia andersonii]|uniref:Uncharacterized protein n=1 Tax=Parasponia andersonii TaxID=3476 RepID=A0A2P5D3S1_PARAD|nr:hypothetical protein PanWU01x14_099410 [Parasponia andersonii]
MVVNCLGLERNARLHVVGDDSIHGSNSKIGVGELMVSNDALGLNFGADGMNSGGSDFEDIPRAGSGLSLGKCDAGIGTPAGLHVASAWKNVHLSFAQVVGNSNVDVAPSHN